MATAGAPVVFIHGLWVHASSWEPWLERFRDEGYEALAPSWPGIPDTVEEARAHPEGMADEGIARIADHFADVVRTLGQPPIVIGHSTGGLVALNLLGRGLVSAAVAIDAAPIKGVYFLPFSTLRVSFPILRHPATRRQTVALTPQQFRYGFGNALSAEESDDLYRRWIIPGPGRPVWEVALANVTPGSPAAVDVGDETRAPLLLISGQEDHTVPPAVMRRIDKLYRKSPALTDFEPMPGRGHSLTMDHGWPDVADAALSWLDQCRP